jgi:hypothetical protein
MFALLHLLLPSADEGGGRSQYKLMEPNYVAYSWFQTFAVFCMLYIFFWVIPGCLNFICRRLGTLCLFPLHRQVSVKWLNLKIVGVSIWEKVGYKNRLSWLEGGWRGRGGSGYKAGSERGNDPTWRPQAGMWKRYGSYQGGPWDGMGSHGPPWHEPYLFHIPTRGLHVGLLPLSLPAL